MFLETATTFFTPGKYLADPAAVRRSLTAALRWRFLRALPGSAPPRTLEAARLIPVLLHASFQHPRLRADAPGVAGLRYRRAWATLARRFSLPPPWRAQRDAPRVEAVLALPGPSTLSLLVVAAHDISRADLRAVEERVGIAQEVIDAAGATCGLRVVEPASLSRDPLLSHRLLLFGALAAGHLSPSAWGSIESAARRPIDLRDLVELAAEAPGHLPSLALTLLCGGTASSPLEVAGQLIEQGTTARELAEPALLCTSWVAASRPAHRALLERALELASPPGNDGALEGDAGAVLALGNLLALPLARAVRSSRRAGLGPIERARWRERVGPDLPRALRAALGARLASGPGLRTELHAAGRRHEVRLAGGAVLGRGGNPAQAKVRALSLLASSALDPLLTHAEPPWSTVAARLALPREQPVLLLLVEPATPSGPPYDPINRGPERRLGFPGGLAVRLAPGRRPTARGLTAPEVVERLLRELGEGTRVEVLAARSEAQPVAARLAQVAELVRDRGALPVAVEAGGQVLLVGKRLLRFRLDRIASRPRIYLADPNSPDLALSPGERRSLGLSGAAVIQCRAQALDASRAAVLYSDRAQGQLREVVFLSDLEEHLREARDLLQAADPRAVLAVHLADGLEEALRRAGPPGPPLYLSVRARLPWDVQVEVEGDWYGGSTGQSWRDAALRLLVRWPRGIDARLAVSKVSAVAHGKRQGGLLALYARSLVLRRTRAHLVRMLRSYQRPRVRRSGG
ncbi:MAG TPA: hypothetical protein VMU15_08985 [Anaeromyxobacter sp.]|nr:hypothetical protein [Anaeromyxobacter sp.]